MYIILYVWVILLHAYLCTKHVSSACWDQKRAWILWTGIPNGWNHDVGSGIVPDPLEKQQVLLSTELSLQPLDKIFYNPFIMVL